MSEARMGGKEVLRVFLKGQGDLLDSFLSRDEGGSKLERGLRDLVQEKYAGRFRVEVTHEPSGDAGSLLSELQSAVAGETGSRLIAQRPDVIVFSLEPDLAEPGWPSPHRVDAAAYLQTMLRVVELLKEDSDAHLVYLNASTVDPDTHVSNFHGVEGDPPSVRAHKLDLALMDLSILEGVSIVDADRLLAEVGAAANVEGFLRYSPQASEVICGELLRILEDYGFFEERPLVMQVGQRGKERT